MVIKRWMYWRRLPLVALLHGRCLQKNVTNPQKIVQYTISAGFVSVILLGCLYFALFYLGATSDAVAQGATNGGQIFLSLCE